MLCFTCQLGLGGLWLHNKANCRDCDQALISNALCALIPPSLEKCFCCDFARLDAGNWAGGRWRCWLVSKSENNGMGQPLVPPGMVAPKPFLWEAAFHLLQISARSMHCSSQLIFASSSATIEAFTGLLQESACSLIRPSPIWIHLSADMHVCCIRMDHKSQMERPMEDFKICTERSQQGLPSDGQTFKGWHIGFGANDQRPWLSGVGPFEDLKMARNH